MYEWLYNTALFDPSNRAGEDTFYTDLPGSDWQPWPLTGTSQQCGLQQ